MYIQIRIPKFGCPHCIDKRGTLFDNEIDRQMGDLKGVSRGFSDLIDSKHDIPEEVSTYILDALDKLDTIRLETLKALGKDVIVEQTEIWGNGK